MLSLPGRVFSSFVWDRQKVRRLFFLFIALSLLTISIFYFASSINRPSMGFILSFKREGWVVENVDANGLARQAGIRAGDRPVEINGEPAEIFLEQYQSAGLVFHFLIQDITVIDESGQLRSVNSLNAPSFSQYLIELATWFLVSLIFWIVGFYVFFKRPNNQAAKLLCLCGLVLGLALTANQAAERLIPLALHLAVIATVIGPWLMAHFFLVLPEERAWLRNSLWVYLIYVPAAITLILYPLIGYADGQTLPAFRTFRMFEIIAGFLAVVGVSIFNYYHKASPRTRQQMKIVSFSCLAALIPFIMLSVLPEALGGKNILPNSFSILFIVFIPLGMGYAVVTERLLDIDLVIRRGVIYGLITVIMALILSAAIIPVMIYKPPFGIIEEILLALALGAVATALFGPAKNSIEKMIDKFFYKDRYDYRQIIHNVSASLNRLKDDEDIARLVVRQTMEALNLAGCCIFIWRPSGFLVTGAATGIFDDIHKQNLLELLTYKRSSAIEFPNPATGANPEVAFMIPLAAGEKELGFLMLSHKVSRQNFSSNDIYFLQGLASVAAVALHSSRLSRDISVRDTFVSIASHELRTPLTSIMGYADLLLLRDDPEDVRRERLKLIADHSQRLSNMVDDLLNVSRIQSGKLGLKLEPVKLAEALEERLNILRERMKGHTLVIDYDPGLPEIMVDRDKFSQVIGNLVDNAIKYSPKGGKITLTARHDKFQRRVVVCVSDEGLGISPADKDTLFTTFHRIQRPETTGIRGSGLGLYIVKEWTKAMGGEVWLESELNQGSAFYVAVPAPETNGKKETSGLNNGNN